MAHKKSSKNTALFLTLFTTVCTVLLISVSLAGPPGYLDKFPDGSVTHEITSNPDSAKESSISSTGALYGILDFFGLGEDENSGPALFDCHAEWSTGINENGEITGTYCGTACRNYNGAYSDFYNCVAEYHVDEERNYPHPECDDEQAALNEMLHELNECLGI